MRRAAYGPGSPRMSAVFRVPEFRALWAAEVLSVTGDQLARLALTVVVLQRTGSPAWSAVVYALTFLPALAGGVLLGPLADRFARRSVMVVADLVRAVMVAAMALPGVPLWALCVLVVLVVLAGAPHTAAQGALLPDVLDGDLLERGIAVRQITAQAAQVVGFAAGGLVVAVLAPPAALLIDAATFGLSALLVGTLVRRGDPSAAREHGGAPSTGRGLRAGLDLVLRHPRRRYLVCIAWLVGIFILPEALAASYAATIGAGAVGTGLLMAADPVGSVVGAVLFTRLVPTSLRDRALVPLAVGAAVPLVVSPLVASPASGPAVSFGLSFALWAVSGACATAALVQAQAGFVRATPVDVRGTATGVAASGLVAAQGVAILLGGLVAERTSPPVALAACGAGGLLLACGVLLLARARGALCVSTPPANGQPA